MNLLLDVRMRSDMLIHALLYTDYNVVPVSSMYTIVMLRLQ